MYSSSSEDWDSLAAWLERSGHHLDAGVPPRRFRGGLANVNYRISIDGQDFVLRRPPAGTTAEGANDMGREAKVLSTLPPVYPLTPSLLLFCGDASVLGVPFQVIEFRHGVTVSDHLPDELAQHSHAAELVTSGLIGAMVDLHALDPFASGLGDLGRPVGFLERQIAGWQRRADAAFDGSPPLAIAKVLERLRSTMPGPGTPRLVHGDFKPDNMLFDPVTVDATAVLDWDMCTLGDPLMDLGVLLSYWIETDDPAPIHELRQVPSLAPGFPSRAELVDAYARASGVGPLDVTFYLLLARLRLAVVWRQLYNLAADDPETLARYRHFDQLSSHVLDWIADDDHVTTTTKEKP